MVSPYPNPPAQEFYLVEEEEDPVKMGLPGISFSTTPTTPASTTITNTDSGLLLAEDPSKKVRKPYTITKSRESWTEQEHDKFLEALHLFDRDWKKIEAFVGSKTVIQIRSHAQKYFLKVQKSGASEHVPPPRPKRKAAHPYPQKAPKNAASQVRGPFQSSALEPGYVISTDSWLVPTNSSRNGGVTSWNCSTVPPVSASHIPKDDVALSGPNVAHNCCSSSNEGTTRILPAHVTHNQGKGKHLKPMRVVPDFTEVYSFIGSVFDPNSSDHLQKLRTMDPINMETVVLLMRNLTVNLTSPEFEDYRKLLSSYNVDDEKVKSCSPLKRCHSDKSVNAIPSM